ncbi:MAG TPA: MlaD family protein [Bryobacteraceae bacterium]|nr:MlaD family protein [Bryobacteraceae bacterium]
MPGTSKTKWAQLKVGIMAIMAFTLLAILIFLLSGGQGFFRDRSNLYVFLNDSAAIAPSAPVRLNGILVGEVSNVALSGSTDPNRVVKITLAVDDQFLDDIPVDSEAEVSQETLLATKYINIKKGQSPQTVKPNAEIMSINRGDFNDVIQQGNSALNSVDAVLKKLDAVVSDIQEGHGTIGKLLVDETLYNKILAIANAGQQIGTEGEKLVTNLNSSSNSVGKLLHDNNELYGQIHDSLAKMNAILDGINQGEGTLGQFMKNPSVYNDTQQVLVQVRQLLAGIEAGQGTAGKLIKSDEMHNQITGTLQRVDTLLDKINNGQGTISQLLNNPQLYESLNGTTLEVQGLVKDFRANPKKFLHIKLGLF